MMTVFWVMGVSLALSAPADDAIPDLSALSFSEAFDSLCAHYSKYYAFSNWKNICWSELHDQYEAEVKQAEATADTSRFKLAMKRFVSSFPDGHVRLRGNLNGIYDEDISGSFGLTFLQLSNSRIVASRILNGGPAFKAGVEVGAIIIQWDGASARDALDSADIIWEGNPPATLDGVQLAKLRRLARTSVGGEVRLRYSNPGRNPVEATLVAEDDSLKMWELSRYTAFNIDGSAVIGREQILEPVRYEILPSGIGYLECSILAEFDEHGHVTGRIDRIVSSLHEAMEAFNADSVAAVIVDVRDNPGGFDRLAAIFGGLFCDDTEVYEHASFYNAATGRFELVPEFTLYLEPQASYFGGMIVCLVNAGTASSAEGIAMAIQRLPRGHVMGFYGTHGSFGLVGGESALPGGIGIQFPLGRSLDSGFEIQIDSGQNLAGGILPDIRIPIDIETVRRKFGNDIDVELQEAEAFLLSALEPSPSELMLHPPRPNPFSSSTRFEFDIAESEHITLAVYDVQGRIVKTLIDDPVTARSYAVDWDGRNDDGEKLQSGVYFCKLVAGESEDACKVILLRDDPH